MEYPQTLSGANALQQHLIIVVQEMMSVCSVVIQLVDLALKNTLIVVIVIVLRVVRPLLNYIQNVLTNGLLALVFKQLNIYVHLSGILIVLMIPVGMNTTVVAHVPIVSKEENNGEKGA